MEEYDKQYGALGGAEEGGMYDDMYYYDDPKAAGEGG